MATIADVAQRAGVSAATVSYAISGKKRLSPETQRRVERAIRALNYQPNVGARALATARTNVLGLMAPLRAGIDLNVIMEFVAGITTAANARGYDILLVTRDADDSHLSRVTRSSQICGLLVMDIGADDPRLERLRSLDIPVVLLGLPTTPGALSCVDLDFYEAGRLAAAHLADRGHRSLALIGSPPEVFASRTSYALRFTAGFAAEAEQRGLGHVEVPTEPSAAGARRTVDRLLAAEDAFTGIVVHNEATLPHVVGALNAAGLDIPRDRSLLAVCPDDVAVAGVTPLTSISVPADRLGTIAVEMLASRLSKPDADGEVRLLAPKISERGSTATV